MSCGIALQSNADKTDVKLQFDDLQTNKLKFVVRHAHMAIDDIDRKVLTELQQDARVSYAELGRRVGLTTPAVIERVRKLEDAGVIIGYRAEIDTAKVGLPITAFVRMSIAGVDYSHIIEVAEQSNEVLECHRGTGGDSFIMKVAVASVEHLQQIIDKLTPYGITTTAIVLSSPVKRRVIDVS